MLYQILWMNELVSRMVTENIWQHSLHSMDVQARGNFANESTIGTTVQYDIGTTDTSVSER